MAAGFNVPGMSDRCVSALSANFGEIRMRAATRLLEGVAGDPEKNEMTDKCSINVHLRPEVYGSYRVYLRTVSVLPDPFLRCIMASPRPAPIVQGRRKEGGGERRGGSVSEASSAPYSRRIAGG